MQVTRERRRTRGGFVVGGGEHLPFRDESFDAILLIDVLEHIADDAGVAREATRVLRPGGRVLCMVPENQALYSRTDAANGHLRRYHRDELLRIFLPCAPETLFDYGFPFMRLYLNVLGRVHDAVVPRSGRSASSARRYALPPPPSPGSFRSICSSRGWFRGWRSSRYSASPAPPPRGSAARVAT